MVVGEVDGLFGREFADVRGTDSASRPCILVINSCYLRGDGVAGEGAHKASVADGAGALDDGAALGADGAVEPRALVKVDARKVKLPQVTSVVHVVQQRVHVRAQAHPCNICENTIYYRRLILSPMVIP